MSFFVYLHKRKGEVFYVGCGNAYRAKDKTSRSKMWKDKVGERPYEIETIKEFDCKADALRLEAELISLYRPSCNIRGNIPYLISIGSKLHRPSKVSGLRLSVESWIKLRALIQAHGGRWLEKLIDREHKKLEVKR